MLVNFRNAILLPVILAGLVACAEKPEHTRAKQLLTEFTCPGGLTKDTNGRWAAMMASDLEKANLFLRNYETGKHMFQTPIDIVIETQLKQYRIACESSKQDKLGL